MPERNGIPRNEAGQAPTRDARETEERLHEKERSQHGGANKERTREQIDQVRSKA